MKHYEISDGSLPFALARWIKIQKAKEEAHQAAMMRRNQKEDQILIQYIDQIAQKWSIITKSDKIRIYNLIEHHEKQKNFTNGQKSIITTLYLKYFN